MTQFYRDNSEMPVHHSLLTITIGCLRMIYLVPCLKTENLNIILSNNDLTLILAISRSVDRVNYTHYFITSLKVLVSDSL